MPEIAVEDKVCANCGVDVREGADFCYNCGKPVSPEATSEIGARTVEAGDAEDHHLNGTATQALISEFPSKDSAPEPTRKLQTAAGLRRRSRSYQAKPVEVEWVKPENSPSTFVIATIALAVLAALLLFAALYLR